MYVTHISAGLMFFQLHLGENDGYMIYHGYFGIQIGKMYLHFFA